MITNQESPSTAYEHIGGVRVAVAQVVKNTAFRISLRVDLAPYTFLTGKLEYELFYVNDMGAVTTDPVPGRKNFKVTVIAMGDNSCVLNCRMKALSSRHEHRRFALRIRLGHPTEDDEFVETFTGVMHTWSRLAQISRRVQSDEDAEWTEVKRKKRARVDILTDSLETTFTAFLDAYDAVSADERPTKLRRIVANLPGERQSLVNDVSYYLSQRETAPVLYLPPDFDNWTLSSPSECELVDVDSFFV